MNRSLALSLVIENQVDSLSNISHVFAQKQKDTEKGSEVCREKCAYVI